MKAKTVWKDIETTPYDDRIIGIHLNKVFLGAFADFRWYNVMGMKLYDVELDERGKILGDAD